ncbi:hypothetical protein CUJ84_pRLN3000009 (plasmid) [Rhizobium leguminosarum]|uniref:Uncharacterized protein n=1 Tax=Rhizobium leguminosarum TaxID=384 RepID=A0A2K9ZGI5_RHILE|nr:hypothetical protein CUJ84_pRLN3000009 [Rhizobium leguminosarum]
MMSWLWPRASQKVAGFGGLEGRDLPRFFLICGSKSTTIDKRWLSMVSKRVEIHSRDRSN